MNLGSTNGAAYIVTGATGAAASDVKVQRVYCSNTRSGIYSLDNSNSKISLENVAGDYADAPAAASLNMTLKGLGCVHAVTAATAIYGTHWYDCFTSLTAGRVGLLMNEPTVLTAAQVTLANGAAFTAAVYTVNAKLTIINNNFAGLRDKVNSIIAALKAD